MKRETNDLSAWFTYPWKHQNLPSITTMDRSWHDHPERKTILPFLICATLLPKGKWPSAHVSRLNQIMLNHLAKSFQKTVSKTARAELIGERHYGCAIEHYYYGPHEGDAFALFDVIHKRADQIKLKVSHDPTWNFYENQIYPSMAQFQCVQNEIITEQKAKKGDQLLAPRRISHYITFPNQNTRNQFIWAARDLGYAFSDEFYSPDSHFPHGICIRNMGAIDLDSVNQYTNALIPLIESYGGAYEYWDCPIIRKS